jgi:uncharacterized protein
MRRLRANALGANRQNKSRAKRKLPPQVCCSRMLAGSLCPIATSHRWADHLHAPRATQTRGHQAVDRQAAAAQTICPQRLTVPLVSSLQDPDRGPAHSGWRIPRIDALRGMALMGILQVNIQSFTWGAGEPLGYLSSPPGVAESILYLFQAAFIQGKFYPIFAFLFGVGIALQTRKLQKRYRAEGRLATTTYRRRLLFLLVLGIAHGLVLYCGDVLTAYAICALAFVSLAPVRLRSLVVVSLWAGAAAVLSIFLPVLLASALDLEETTSEIPASIVRAHEIYCYGGFFSQLGQRWIDELWQQIASIPTFWPQVIALFALGSLAGRLGWLQHPGRHALVWRRAWVIGLGVGLPTALLGAAMNFVRARDLPGAEAGWDQVVLGTSSVLSMAYIAAAVYAFDQPWGAIAQRWLASAGRMSLSNYLGQSLIMGALLSGWGLGWGANASRAQLAMLALLIFIGQVALSNWLLASFRQGPIEALWRRWTYQNAASPG